MAGVALVVIVIGVALLTGLVAGARPGVSGEARPVAAAIIFVASYLALAIGKIPGFRIDRAGVALVGAGLMVAAGVLSPEDAYQAIDLDTITLLLGLMIVVANLRLSGFFSAATAWIVERTGRPWILLCLVTAVSGIFSAFLVNDAICLVLAPLVLEMTSRMGRKPLPYLLAVAMASNVGSTATITGNPQNILIGGFSHIPYSRFALTLGPVALIGLVLTALFIALLYRDEFRGGGVALAVSRPERRLNRVLVWRALLASCIMIGLFFAGQPPAKVAIVVGGCLLLTRRVKSARIYAEIDWSLLLMFSGLFIIVAGARRVLVTPDVLAAVGHMHLDQIAVLSPVTAVLSNLISNVPAVLMIRPFIDSLPRPDAAWLTVAMASTLAGNFTILGSIANLIVVQKAAARGVEIGFWDYFRVGAPLTVVTVTIGTLYLCW